MMFKNPADCFQEVRFNIDSIGTYLGNTLTCLLDANAHNILKSEKKNNINRVLELNAGRIETADFQINESEFEWMFNEG